MKQLIDRFPDISLFLTLTSFEPFELFKDKEGKMNAKRKKEGKIQFLHSSKSISQEVDLWFSELDLTEVEILYIYGLGLGYYYEPLKSWLKEKKERALVFIEDDIAVIDACFKANAVDLLEDPQVHLRFIPHKKQWKEVLEGAAHFFPSDRLLFTALESYAIHSKKIAKMRLFLQRTSALFDALLTEVLKSHRLFENLYPNFKRLPDSFYINAWRGQFKNVPAIICGAGPSLTHAIPVLKGLEEQAFIIAGGSTITALSVQGIIPHLGIALDPNALEYSRLKNATAFEMPFIYAPRLFPEVFSLCNGPFGYVRSDTGGAAENWLEKQLQMKEEAIGPDLGREALSVTTIAVALAKAMGCNPILFVGVDLAFTNRQLYATGVVTDKYAALEKMKKEKKAIEQLLRKKDRHGKFVYTLVKWVMESATISAYAKKHPEHTFINCTEGGIGFPDIPYRPLEEVLREYHFNPYDLRSWIHAEIERTRLREISSHDLADLFETVKQSLQRSAHLVDEMIQEKSSGRLAVLEMDLQEEIAFECCLQAVSQAIERITQRFSSDSFNEKCIHYQTMIESYLKTLNKFSLK